VKDPCPWQWLAGPNRISSSGRWCSDRFKLDQLSWVAFPELRRTASNCNPALWRDPLLGRSVCAAGQPVCTQVNRCIGLSGSDRKFPALTGRSGTQRARSLRPELAALLGVWPSYQLAGYVGGRAGWQLSGAVAVHDCCTGPGRLVSASRDPDDWPAGQLEFRISRRGPLAHPPSRAAR
jgi:hypothetical protein